MAKTRIVIEATDKAGPEIDKLRSKLTGFGRDVSNLANPGSSPIQRLSGFMTTLAGKLTAVTAIVGVAGAAVAKLTQVYKEQAESQARLSGVLSNLSGGYETLSGRINAIAGDIQKLTTIDDTKIVNSLTRFAEIGIESKNFEVAANAVANLSVVMGNTEQATEALVLSFTNAGRGLNQLERYGITFTAAEKEKIRQLQETGRALEAQEIILGRVQEKYGDLAASVSDIPTKQMDRLTNAVNDLLEALSEAIFDLPIIGDIVAALVSGLEGLTNILQNTMAENRMGKRIDEVLRAMQQNQEISPRLLASLAAQREKLGNKLFDEMFTRQMERLTPVIPVARVNAEDARIALVREIKEMETKAQITLDLDYEEKSLAKIEAAIKQVTRALYLDDRDLMRKLNEIRGIESQATPAINRRAELLRLIGEAQQKSEQAYNAQARATIRQSVRREVEPGAAVREPAFDLDKLVSQYIPNLAEWKRLKADLELLGKKLAEAKTEQEAATIRSLMEKIKSNMASLVSEQFIDVDIYSERLDRMLETFRTAQEIEIEQQGIYERWLERLTDAQERGDTAMIERLQQFGLATDYIADKMEGTLALIVKTKQFLEKNQAVIDNSLKLFSNLGQLAVMNTRRELEEMESAFKQKKEMYDNEYRIRKAQGEDLAQFEVDRKNDLAAEQEKVDAKRRQMEYQEANWRKATALAQATVQGAMGVINALATPPAPNLLMAGLMASLVASQIAIIAAEPIPQLAKGGIVKATPGGRIVQVAEAGKDEAVIPLDKLKQGQEIVVNIGTVVGTPTREVIEAIQKGIRNYNNGTGVGA